MAIVSISTLPAEVTLEQVLAVSKAIRAGGPLVGGISHVVIVDDGRVKVLDVWESQAALDTFNQERLMPAVQQYMASGDPGQAPPRPEVQIFEAHDVMTA